MNKLRIALSSLLIFLGLVAGDVNFNESRAVLKAVATPSVLTSPTISNPTFTGTISGPLWTSFARAAIPFELAPTGTMANNGAVTLGTALVTTHSGGCWLYLPANAISAGSAAGWYWTVMSSTTLGTVYNSTYTSGEPRAGTTTAFVTTGPGAFTGATGLIVGPSITLAAGRLGANGAMRTHARFIQSNNANAKSIQFTLGTTDFLNAVSIASTQSYQANVFLANRGVVTIQEGHYGNFSGTTGVAGSIGTATFGAENTAGALAVAIKMNRGTATDTFGLQSFYIEILSDGS